jgi:hypothetical protein
MKENAMTMEQHALARGEERGLRQGVQQGVQQGLQRAVRRQAEARFGALDAATLERIAHASTTDLERWLDRMLSAASLEELMAV